MKKTKKYAVAFLVIAAAIYFFTGRAPFEHLGSFNNNLSFPNSNQPLNPITKLPSSSKNLTLNATDTPTTHVSAIPSSSSPTKDSGESRVLDLAPSISKIRSDVAKNPHEPPRAMLRFAMELGAKFKLAMDSPQNANEFFEELKECTLSTRVKIARETQALCLANARRLATFFPDSLGSSYLQLFQQADPEVKNLLPPR